MTEMEKIISRNSLSRQLSRKLEDWIIAHRPRLADGLLTCDQIALLACKELGFTVVGRNVATAYSTLELEVPRAHQRVEKLDSAALAAFQRQLDLNNRRIQFLARGLGVAWPADLEG